MKLYFIGMFLFDALSDEMKKQTGILEGIDANFKTANAEAKRANDEVVKLRGEYAAEVKKINEDMAAKKETLEKIKEAVDELQAKAGRIIETQQKTVTNARIEIAKKLEQEHTETLSKKAIKSGKWFDIEQKTVGNMTASANLTGAVVATYNTTPAVRGRQLVHYRDLVRTVPSATGLWKFYKQNIPAGEGSVTFQTTHGNAKTQLDYDLTETNVTCEFLAGYTRVARQMLQDLPFLQSFINDELIEDYLRTESFNGFDSLGNGGGATGSNTTSASVTVEKIIDYIANIMQRDYMPTAVVCRPAVWASIIKTKPNDYSVPGGVTISPSGDIMIVGIPIVACTTNALSDSKVLVGDWTKAAIVQSEGLSVGMFEQDQDNVIKNLVTVRVESRIGFATLRGDAFVYGNA
jgi:HK97 family phage major capsid protein